MKTNKRLLFVLSYLVISICAVLLVIAEITYTPQYYLNPHTAQSDSDMDTSICDLKVVECDIEPTIENQIRTVANEYQIDSDPALKISADLLINLAICESTLNPDRIGGLADCFIGLYQWNMCAGVKITEECARDIECSTIATIDALQKGEYWRWPYCLSELL